MPSHWAFQRLNVVTQFVRYRDAYSASVGCAEAALSGHASNAARKAAAITGSSRMSIFRGDEVTSFRSRRRKQRGRILGALNTASNGVCRVLFSVQDNGYAISVPVEVQPSGGSISRLVSGFPNFFHFVKK